MNWMAIFAGAILLAAPAATEKPELGKKLDAEFALTDMDGEQVRFSDMMKEEKIHAFIWWSCKCPWAKAWDKTALKDIYKEYSQKGVEFVLINSNVTENKNEMKEYLEEKDLPYRRIFIDPKAKVADVFEAKTTPHVFVFDQKGVLAYRGAINNDAKMKKDEQDRKHYLRNALDALLKGKVPETVDTKPVGCSVRRPKS